MTSITPDKVEIISLTSNCPIVAGQTGVNGLITYNRRLTYILTLITAVYIIKETIFWIDQNNIPISIGTRFQLLRRCPNYKIASPGLSKISASLIHRAFLIITIPSPTDM